MALQVNREAKTIEIIKRAENRICYVWGTGKSAMVEVKMKECPLMCRLEW
jgi:hypothetical protein